MYYLNNTIAIHDASIIPLDITTQDANDEGYLLTDGTNRSISCGINTDGQLMLWMETNGDPCIVPDDHDDLLSWCQDMGDAPDNDHDRIVTGAERLIQAVEATGQIYANETAAENLEWYTDKANEALAAQKGINNA